MSPRHGIQAKGSKPTAPEVDCIDVICNGTKAVFLVQTQTIICRCHHCLRSGPDGARIMSPTEFERHSGMAASKKWRRSIKVDAGDGSVSLGRWLDMQGIKTHQKHDDDDFADSRKHLQPARQGAHHIKSRLDEARRRPLAALAPIHPDSSNDSAATPEEHLFASAPRGGCDGFSSEGDAVDPDVLSAATALELLRHGSSSVSQGMGLGSSDGEEDSLDAVYTPRGAPKRKRSGQRMHHTSHSPKRLHRASYHKQSEGYFESSSRMQHAGNSDSEGDDGELEDEWTVEPLHRSRSSSGNRVSQALYQHRPHFDESENLLASYNHQQQRLTAAVRNPKGHADVAADVGRTAAGSCTADLVVKGADRLRSSGSGGAAAGSSSSLLQAKSVSRKPPTSTLCRMPSKDLQQPGMLEQQASLSDGEADQEEPAVKQYRCQQQQPPAGIMEALQAAYSKGIQGAEPGAHLPPWNLLQCVPDIWLPGMRMAHGMPGLSARAAAAAAAAATAAVARGKAQAKDARGNDAVRADGEVESNAAPKLQHMTTGSGIISRVRPELLQHKPPAVFEDHPVFVSEVHQLGKQKLGITVNCGRFGMFSGVLAADGVSEA